MSEMVERLAEGLWSRALTRCGINPLPSWPQQSEEVKSPMRIEARAIIVDMREPSDGMCVAGIESGAVENDIFHIRDYHLRPLWHSMIDEALK